MSMNEAQMQSSATPCPVCGNPDLALWGEVDSYKILQCSGCGLGMTSPVPPLQELEELNRDLYTLEKRIKAYLPKQRYFEKRYRRSLATLKQFKANGRLLDVGCNIGLFLKVAREEGFDVTGVELNKECAEFGTSHFGVTIRSEYLEDVSSELGQFDVITLFDVLEHIPDMTSFMGAVRGALKDNGVLVVQLPNLGSLMADIAKSKWGWLTPPDHLYHFTPQALRLFLEANGFEMVMLRTWEPANEFVNNALSAWCPPGSVAKIACKVVKELKLMLLPVLCLRQLWWRRERGALIELCAVKRAAAGGDL